MGNLLWFDWPVAHGPQGSNGLCTLHPFDPQFWQLVGPKSNCFAQQIYSSSNVVWANGKVWNWLQSQWRSSARKVGLLRQQKPGPDHFGQRAKIDLETNRSFNIRCPKQRNTLYFKSNKSFLRNYYLLQMNYVLCIQCHGPLLETEKGKVLSVPSDQSLESFFWPMWFDYWCYWPYISREKEYAKLSRNSLGTTFFSVREKRCIWFSTQYFILELEMQFSQRAGAYLLCISHFAYVLCYASVLCE